MHKFATALAVWALFIFIMGIVYPIELTNGANTITQVLHSYTIYGFFSLIPIVFYGGGLSLFSDWIAKRFPKYFHGLSLFLHMLGGAFVYLFTVNIDIMLLAIVASILFFVIDRAFLLLRHREGGNEFAHGFSMFLGVNGVLTMVVASTL